MHDARDKIPDEQDTPAEMLEKMLANNIYVTTSDMVFDARTHIQMKLKYFHERYSAFKVLCSEKNKNLSISQIWSQSRQRKIVDDIRCLPHLEPGIITDALGAKIFNTWRPLDFSEEGGDAAELEALLVHLIPDKLERRHFRLWLGYKLKHPDIRQWAVVLMAADNVYGTGRGTLAKILKKLFRPENVVQPGFDAFTETTGQNQYNEWMLSLLAVVDEAQSSTQASSMFAKKAARSSVLRSMLDPSSDAGTLIKRKGLPNYSVDRLPLSTIICCHGLTSVCGPMSAHW